MAVPALEPSGLLPVGVHEASFEELRDRFGSFQRTDRRPSLFKRLEAFVAELRASRLVTIMLIDGSFVTSADEPNDVDVILVLPQTHNFGAELLPFQYNVLSRRAVRRRHGIDLLVAVEGSTLLDEYVEFFSQVRGRPDVRKGMLSLSFQEQAGNSV